MRRLGLSHAAVAGPPEDFGSIRRTSWSNSWPEALISAANEVDQALDDVEGASEALLASTKLPLVADRKSAATALTNLPSLLPETYPRDLRCAFAPDCPAKIEAAKKALELIGSARPRS